jgi:IrrE N-terminal-like domain
VPELLFAERLLQNYGITAPEEIDLEAIAYDQGAFVKYRALDGCEARIIGIGNSAIITIDPNALLERQRFSLAHEIAHWLNDRGTLAYDCKKSDIGPQKTHGGSRESAANRFAGQLLMPDYLFCPLCAKKPLDFLTARELGKRFRTSLTATAIKLVNVGNSPGIVVCHKNERLAWSIAGPDVPKCLQRLWPTLDHDTQAYELHSGELSNENTRPRRIGSESWIDHECANDYNIIEHSIKVALNTVVTLLWWEDESQIRDFDEY